MRIAITKKKCSVRPTQLFSDVHSSETLEVLPGPWTMPVTENEPEGPWLAPIPCTIKHASRDLHESPQQIIASKGHGPVARKREGRGALCAGTVPAADTTPSRQQGTAAESLRLRDGHVRDCES